MKIKKLTKTLSAMYFADFPTSFLLSPIACSYVAGTPILNRFTAAGQESCILLAKRSNEVPYYFLPYSHP